MSSPAEIDLGEAHVQRQDELERAARLERARARLAGMQPPGGSQPPEGPPLADPSTPAPAPQGGVTPGAVAKDVSLGAVEAPRQALGGISDAVQQTGKAVKDVADWVSSALPDALGGGLIYEPGRGVRWASGEEIRNAPGVVERLTDAISPDIDPADTVTGSMVRGTAQFLTGFLGSGKVQALQSLGKLGTAGEVASALGRGALADFAAFDPQQERLSNLIQEVPALANPVTEYLAADPADSDAEGRFKQTLEGLGLGAATEGLSRGVRALRAMRATKTAAGVDDSATAALLQDARKQRERLIVSGGDPDARKAFEVRPSGVEGVEGPAAEALARGAKAGQPGEVFVNWNTISAPEDVKAIVQEMANTHADTINTARRGVRSWAETKLSAAQKDAWEVLGQRQKGQPLNAEESLAVRELWVRSGTALRDLAEQVRQNPGDLNKIAFRRQLTIHNAIQEQVIAARTETARSLNAWAIKAGDDAAFAKQMEGLRDLIRSDDQIDLIAQKLGELTDAGMDRAAETFVQGAALAKGRAAINQLFYFSRLSSPFTHVRNFLGNTAAIPMQMLESKAANLIGKALGQQNIPDGETTARAFGYLYGTQRALRTTQKGREVFGAAFQKHIAGDPAAARELLAANAAEVSPVLRSMLTGESGIGIGKVQEARRGAFDPTVIGVDKDSVLGRVLSYFDTATTVPSRALQVSDELFKTMSYDAELSAQAFRKAHDEMSRGLIQSDQFNGRIAELLTDPDEYMQLASANSAEVQTFSQQPLNTRAWRGWKGMAEFPVIGKLAIPFKKTPFNIATYTFQRTPLAPFVKQWREDVLAGGARGDLAWSKFVVGNTLLLSAADLAMKGDLTGEGPPDPKERETLSRSGWQPNSVRVRVGGSDAKPTYRYFSYRGMEPIASTLGLAANTVDILNHMDWDSDDIDAEELGIAASMSIAAQVTSQSYMSGMAALFDALSDPQRYGENYWERIATIPVPLAVSQIAKTTDPTVRMTESLIDSMKAQIPGMSKGLPPQRDLWGRPITRSSGLGDFYDAVSPIYSKTSADAQPIDVELNRLEHYVSKPPKKLTFGGADISLRNEPKIYSRYVELAGNKTKIDGKGLMDTLNAIVSGKDPRSKEYQRYSDGPDGSKALMIDTLVSGFREVAKQQLLEEFPELRAKLDAERRKKAQDLRPR